MKLVFLALGYLIFIHYLLLVPAMGLFGSWRSLTAKPGYWYGVAYAATLGTLAMTALCGYVLGIKPIVTAIGLWMIIGFGSYRFLKLRAYRQLWSNRRAFTALIVLSLISTLVISLHSQRVPKFIPDPIEQTGRHYDTLNVRVLNFAHTNANDNYIPYRQAQFILNHSNPATDSFIGEWGVHFFQRTPLMGAVTAAVLSLTHERLPVDYLWSNAAHDPGHTYAKFQVLADVLNALFLVPLFFLAKQLFGEKVAVITCGFLSISHFYVYNSVFSWPKSLVAFFVLLAYWVLLKDDNISLGVAAMAAGLAYLTHDLAILYIGPILLMLLIKRRWRAMFGMVGGFSLFAVPWILTSALRFHKSSSFFLYPFSLDGIPKGSDTSSQLMGRFAHTPVLKILSIKFESLVYLLSPYQLFTSEGGQGWGMRNWALGLFSVPGSLGYGLMLLMPAVVVRFRKLRLDVLWLLVLPVIGSVIIIGWAKGLGSLHFVEAGVAVLVMTIVATLVDRPRLLVAALVINAAQLVVAVADGYQFDLSTFTRPASDIVITGLLIAIVGWQILNITKVLISKKTA